MVTIVGGGFAGVECAWICANAGLSVTLYEMRPVRMTPAHTTDKLAELVCSNSFKSQDPDTPAGQLKSEMVALGSLVIPTGHKHSVPGGSALAVDRNLFANEITHKIESHPNISISREEFTPDMAEEVLAQGNPLVLATGPLTSQELGDWLAEQTGQEHLYFYDAVAPTVEADSLDRSIIFAQSRYDKGEGDDYLNCPFNKEEYDAFVTALVAAERVPLKDFEDPKYFEGCKPIEEIAQKGHDSLRFGNFKPVGLRDPRTGRRPWAALQLRPENREKTLYSLVACQTRMKWGVQTQVLKMVPGLAEAEFVRLGVIHRNTYINSPRAINQYLESSARPGLYVAGQLTGVEGYVESAAMGILVGHNIVHRLQGFEAPLPPRSCAYGSLLSHLQDETERDFAPMNINWGLFPDPEENPKSKAERRALKLQAARSGFEDWRTKLQRTSAKA
ncbi:methylenetetrahydrofolate--tRNA-(uracil(54)-C(5))-methyltransferase (FADH(2)-oxidizing) TrmFO [Kamptonema cortianum]|nr:methylenetetrahydrofolate--tRNA-(uracil(54)-C(5))-methyltransferase (FADH(2)-oxidizing) TrmFO [Geitlerinema splendidum]MDK3158507.1 methylenetetrahydrofolate--tRNA-(uracil(54)-C(5))-methyltransferase (FADH(2)-oxidizing) TrmFO [Kamptonema cortianum]